MIESSSTCFIDYLRFSRKAAEPEGKRIVVLIAPRVDGHSNDADVGANGDLNSPRCLAVSFILTRSDEDYLRRNRKPIIEAAVLCWLESPLAGTFAS